MKASKFSESQIAYVLRQAIRVGVRTGQQGSHSQHGARRRNIPHQQVGRTSACLPPLPRPINLALRATVEIPSDSCFREDALAVSH